MQEREIRLLFERGHFTSAQVGPDPHTAGWNVTLYARDEKTAPEVLSAKRGGARVFRTSDAALTWCQEIGFEVVTFKLESEAVMQAVDQEFSNSSILLVEDNEDDVVLTLRAFRKKNISNQVVVKRDGQEALDFLFKQDAGRQKKSALPCLVILDLHLPKRDGFEVLKEIRSHQRTRRLPVVILTTSQEPSDIAMGYDLGSNSYLHKPVDTKTFDDMVNHIGNYWLHLNICPNDKPPALA